MDEAEMTEAADAAQDTDDGSIFTRNELEEKIREKFAVYKDTAYQQQVSRRQFLKIIGIAAATATVSATGLERLSHRPQTPTGHLTISGTQTLSQDQEMGHDSLVVESGAELIIDGDVTLKWDGYNTFKESRGVLSNAVDIAGRVSFANEGDTLTLDQTGNNLGLHTQLSSGAHFGDGRGDIIFNGEADVLASPKRGTPHFMLTPPESGAAIINRVAWPHGSGTNNTPDCSHDYGSNIGFSGSFWKYTSQLLMQNCLVWGFSHNLFYWYKHYGSLMLQNCLIEHSGSRGISIPKEGLAADGLTLNIGGKNAAQYFSCGVGATGFQVELGDDEAGEHRVSDLKNVHVLSRQERCYDGKKVRYGFEGAMFGNYYTADGKFTFNLTDCHSEVDPNPGSVDAEVVLNGNWGSNAECGQNPIKNPKAFNSIPPGGSSKSTDSSSRVSC